MRSQQLVGSVHHIGSSCGIAAGGYIVGQSFFIQIFHYACLPAVDNAIASLAVQQPEGGAARSQQLVYHIYARAALIFTDISGKQVTGHAVIVRILIHNITEENLHRNSCFLTYL